MKILIITFSILVINIIKATNCIDDINKLLAHRTEKTKFNATTLRYIFPKIFSDDEARILEGYDSLYNNGMFLAFRVKDQNSLNFKTKNPLEIKNITISYLNWYFHNLERLKSTKQANVLASVLNNHFIDANGQNSYQVLQKLSHKNKFSYFPNLSLTDEEKKLSSNITLSFLHNTASGHRIDKKTPLLSSKEINMISGEVGTNSKNYFNKEYLKSDGNIFSFAVISINGHHNHKSVFYGDKTIKIIDNKDLRKSSYIASYIMWPEDLPYIYLNQANQSYEEYLQSRPSLDELINKLTRVYTKDYNENYNLPIMDKFLKDIPTHFFTIDHFEQMIRYQFIKELRKIKGTKEYDIIINNLNSDNPNTEVIDLIEIMIYERPPFTTGAWELRTPVSIDSKYVKGESKY